MGWGGGGSQHHRRLLLPIQATLQGGVTVGFPSHSWAYVMCALKEVRAPGCGARGLVLWPKLYFSLCPCMVSHAWTVSGTLYIHKGNVEKDLFSYTSVFSPKGAGTRGPVVGSPAPAWSEPPLRVLSLSALDHLFPAGVASIHILHHHFQADVAHGLPPPSCSPAYLPF